MRKVSLCYRPLKPAWKNKPSPFQFCGANLLAVLKELGRRGILQVCVEGGAELQTAFLKQNLVQEIVLYQGACLLGGTALGWPSHLCCDQPMKNFDPDKEDRSWGKVVKAQKRERARVARNSHRRKRRAEEVVRKQILVQTSTEGVGGSSGAARPGGKSSCAGVTTTSQQTAISPAVVLPPVAQTTENKNNVEVVLPPAAQTISSDEEDPISPDDVSSDEDTVTWGSTLKDYRELYLENRRKGELARTMHEARFWKLKNVTRLNDDVVCEYLDPEWWARLCPMAPEEAAQSVDGVKWAVDVADGMVCQKRARAEERTVRRDARRADKVANGAKMERTEG